MTIDPLLFIGVLAIIIVLAFLLQVKWNFRGPEKPAPRENPAPQFHASSAPPRAKKPVSWSSLTRRERDIVRLVAQGLTNEEIARKLDISKRTVESHLNNIFRKLDVRSRSDLIELPPRDDAPKHEA